MYDRRSRGAGGKRRRDVDEGEAVLEGGDSDEDVGNTEDSDWRERAGRVRRDQLRRETAKRRRGGGEDGVT